MHRLLEWLLGLERIELGRDRPLQLQWVNAAPAWLLFLCAVAAVAWIVLVYRREPGSRARRTLLAVVRAALVALVAAMICQPVLVWQRNRVEPSYVALLVDTSLSMATTDVYRDESAAQAVAAGARISDPADLSTYTRLALIQRALTDQSGDPLAVLLARNAVQLCTFDSELETRGLFARGSSSEGLHQAVAALDADGAATDLAGAVLGVMEGSQGRRLAGVVLLSDGRSTQAGRLRDALDRARDRQVPVFAVRVGSAVRARDLEISAVRAEETVFLQDPLAVEAAVRGHGITEPVEVAVELVDEEREAVVAAETVSLSPANPAVVVELRTKATMAGRRRYRVRVVPLPDERLTDNNVEQVDVTVVEDEVRVLLVEAYPRYEYRYLKNALARESTVRFSVLLLEADERFVQEGTDPVRRFPETPEELSPFDVVLFGDVDPRGGWLSEAQMKMLLDFVGNEGGGFGIIAGERAAPHRFAGTPLERLLPVRIDPTFLGTYEGTLVSGFVPILTPEGRAHRILRFLPDSTQNEALMESLPELFWYARTLGPKPGATVLLEHPTERTAYGALPLIALGRYGAGQLYFQATDDTWRWRRHTGELLHDTYWLRVVRELLADRGASRDRRFALRTDRRRYAYGQTVQAMVEVFDSSLLGDVGRAIPLEVSRAHDAAPEGDDTTVSSASQDSEIVVGGFEAERLGSESNRFEGAWTAPRPGRYVLSAPDLPRPPGTRAVGVLFRVDPPDLEFQQPEADHATLERMAESTGGRLLSLAELATGFDEIRDRSVQVPDDVVEPLWDARLVLLLFAAMISMEWVLRKVFGML